MGFVLVTLFWLIIGVSGWRVFSRAGFKGYLGLLFLLPFLNFIALLYLAYKDWPSIPQTKPVQRN